jgi:hypothetical protein
MNPVNDWQRTPAPRATLPVRDGSRNSSAHSSAPEIGDATATAPQQCPVCAAPLPSPRARYCSAACRQRAFRLRHPSTPSANDQAARRVTDLAHLTRELQRQRVRVAHTVYECPRCETRLVGERRCPECHVFCRALGLGGHCPDCDQPILLADLVPLGTLPGKEANPPPVRT